MFWISQPAIAPAAPKKSRGGFFLGIGCGAVIAVLGLYSLGTWLSEKDAADTPNTAETPGAAETSTGETTTPPQETVPVTESADGVAGTFVKTWVDHNIQDDGRSGMLIHAHFVIEGARQDSCQATAYFHYENGEILKNFDDDFGTPNGQVAVWDNFTPEYDSTEFEDFKLFIPYDELHMAVGHHELKFNLQLHHLPSGTMVVESPFESFTLDQK